MKVLVTGGAGFIGSHTVDALLERGHDVCILDSLTPPVHPGGRRPDYLPRQAEFVQGDVRDRQKLAAALEGVEIVFHLAAYQDYLTDFSTFASVNDGGTALLYELIVNEHLPVRKVVLASSQAVYGEGLYSCPQHGLVQPPPRPLAQLERGEWEVRCPGCGRVMEPRPLTEEYANPHNQYAVSKYCQELYALTLGRRYGIPTVVLRYSITQGPRQSFYNAYSGILRSFVVRLLGGQPPVIYEDGRQLRDYLYVGDAVKANLLVMESAAADYQVFNVGGTPPVTVQHYAGMVVRLSGRQVVPRLAGEFRFGDSRHTFSDATRLRALGWEAKTPLEHVIREYLEWASSQPEIPCHHHDAAARIMKQTDVIRSVRQPVSSTP